MGLVMMKCSTCGKKRQYYEKETFWLSLPYRCNHCTRKKKWNERKLRDQKSAKDTLEGTNE